MRVVSEQRLWNQCRGILRHASYRLRAIQRPLVFLLTSRWTGPIRPGTQTNGPTRNGRTCTSGVPGSFDEYASQRPSGAEKALDGN